MIKDILIIDDEVGIRELLMKSLKVIHSSLDMQLMGRMPGEILKRKPDLILLDIWMPDVTD